MAHKSRYEIPAPTGKCPHCGLVHTAADLMRLDSNWFQCKSCGKSFLSGPTKDHQIIHKPCSLDLPQNASFTPNTRF